MMHQVYMHHDNKMVQDKIINNFWNPITLTFHTHLCKLNQGTPTGCKWRMSQHLTLAWVKISDMDNAIDLTQGHDATNMVQMIPKFASLLNNITGTVDYTSDESSGGEKVSWWRYAWTIQGRQLMKACWRQKIILQAVVAVAVPVLLLMRTAVLQVRLDELDDNKIKSHQIYKIIK